MAVVDVAEIHALHGRRVSGTRANIDRFVMGPAGVFVIDAKRYEGQIHIHGVDGEFRTAGRVLRAARILGPPVDYPGNGGRAPRGRCLAVRLREDEHPGHDRPQMRWSDVLGIVAGGANA
jgi:Nuclease-related domain